jgi:H+-transporting ATPase
MADPEKTDTISSKNPSDPQNPTTTTESANVDEKTASDQRAAIPTRPADDDEDVDIDALIDALESEDGHEDQDEVESVDAVPGARAPRPISEEWFKTNTCHGLTETEVSARRKKFGWNKMKEEKENLFLKFLGYFIGPIQFVMEVCASLVLSSQQSDMDWVSFFSVLCTSSKMCTGE